MTSGDSRAIKVITSTLVVVLSVAIGIATNKVSEKFTWGWAAGLAMFALGVAAIQILDAWQARSDAQPDGGRQSISVAFTAGRDIVVGHPVRLMSLMLTSILVIAIAILVAVLAIRPQRNPPHQTASEEQILEKLEPGGTYARFKQLLNQEADKEDRIQDGFIAQFDRESEYIHAVVNGDGKVLAITVVLKDGATLRPSHLGGWPYPFGKTVAQHEDALRFEPDGAAGVCGARHGAYLNVYNTTDASYDFQRMAFGFIDTGDFDCTGIDIKLTTCDPNENDGGFGACLDRMEWKSAPARQVREKIAASAIVVTAPDVDITTEMLRFTYDFARF
ncbi:hypothetical protein ACFY36_42060 [Actinoplanes sp. NPDC000266]